MYMYIYIHMYLYMYPALRMLRGADARECVGQVMRLTYEGVLDALALLRAPAEHLSGALVPNLTPKPIQFNVLSYKICVVDSDLTRERIQSKTLFCCLPLLHLRG